MKSSSRFEVKNLRDGRMGGIKPTNNAAERGGWCMVTKIFSKDG
jgi:hypothetical protein